MPATVTDKPDLSPRTHMERELTPMVSPDFQKRAMAHDSTHTHTHLTLLHTLVHTHEHTSL